MHMRRSPVFDRLAQDGAIFQDALVELKPEWKTNYLAMDATQPGLTTSANAGIPAFLATVIDPAIVEVLFTPNKATDIFGEVQKGNWVMDTAMFQMVESTGEVSSYGDYSDNGRAGVNTQFENRQSYHYQVIIQYGEREMERAGLARLSWASELQKSAVTVLNKFQNLTYFFGVSGLLNYGLLNDPSLSAALTPATKASPGTGTQWILNGSPNATALEVYNDIVALFIQLVNQSAGLIQQDTPVVIAMSPASMLALSFTNIYGLRVKDLLKDNYPNIRFESAVQYGAVSASNPQGVVGGNLVQIIATNVGGQDTGYCAFTEKLRTHPLIRDMSSFKQKQTQGTWGAIVRMPMAIASMLGV